MTKSRDLIKRICFIAAFAAISSVLYCYVKFPLPIFPSFLDINISMIPVIIATFMLTPVDGFIVVLIRLGIKLLIVGSSTAYVGEVADLIIGGSVALVSGSIFRYTKFKHKEIYAFISVAVVWVLAGVLTNIFINIPFYLDYYFKGNWDPLIGMCRDAFKLISFGGISNVNKDNFMFYYVTMAVIPFNLLLSLIVILFTALVHKKLRVLYDSIDLNFNKKNK